MICTLFETPNEKNGQISTSGVRVFLLIFSNTASSDQFEASAIIVGRRFRLLFDAIRSSRIV